MAFSFQVSKMNSFDNYNAAIHPKHDLISVNAPVFGKDAKLSPHLAIVLADKGFMLEQVCLPWRYFTDRGFVVEFVIAESIFPPRPPKPNDSYMTGWKSHVLGASKEILDIYSVLCTLNEFNNPKCYRSNGFTFDNFSAVFITGGRNPFVREMLEDPLLHASLVPYIHSCRTIQPDEEVKDNRKIKVLGAISQGAAAIFLAEPNINMKSTTIPAWMERSNSFLNPTPDNSTYPYAATIIPKDKYVSGPYRRVAFTYQDENYYYISGRSNKDIGELSKKMYLMYKQAYKDLNASLRERRRRSTSNRRNSGI